MTTFKISIPLQYNTFAEYQSHVVDLFTSSSKFSQEVHSDFGTNVTQIQRCLVRQLAS